MRKDLGAYNADKQIYQQVSLEERPAFLKRVMAVEQKKGEYPLYKKDYPNTDTWDYNGLKLNYYYARHGEESNSAVLFYFHGMNAHGNSSGYMGMGLHESLKLDIYALDFMNFGRSEGADPGYIGSVDDQLDQADKFINHILTQYKQQKKIFISGLSLGGAICFKLSLKNPGKFAGVILLSPALRENRESMPFMKKIGRITGSLFPKLRLVPQTFNQQSKVDQTDRIMKDPYIYKDKVVPGSAKAVLDAMDELEGQYAKMTDPYILIQSGTDKLVDPFLGVDFERESKSEDKTVVYFKDMWHAIFGEDELPQVLDVLTQWLKERV